MLLLQSMFQRVLGDHTRDRKFKVRAIVGAGEDDTYKGWIATNKPQLDLLRKADWDKRFGPNGVDTILAEHVWEHLDSEAAIIAARNCFTYLKPDGYLRVAVPDGLHPNEDYIEYVRPGGWDVGSDDHRVLYTYRTLTTVFEAVGFEVTLLEYFDERGTFREEEWSPADGRITRSARFDSRNFAGDLRYTSIILDARKPLNAWGRAMGASDCNFWHKEKGPISSVTRPAA